MQTITPLARLSALVLFSLCTLMDSAQIDDKLCGGVNHLQVGSRLCA